MKILPRTLIFKYIFPALVVLFLVTRLFNLGILPIFNDESTYIRYGLHQIKAPEGQFYSLLIGKEPLLPYLFAQAGNISKNLLIGARVVSIFFGFLTFLGIFFTAKYLFGRGIGVVAGLFYIFCPYTLFFDRLALMESAVSAICIWSLYFSIKYLKTFEKINILWLGIIAGIGTWIKTPAFFYVFLPAIFGVAEYIQNRGKNKKNLYIIGSTIIALIIFLPLYLNPFYKNHLKLLGLYSYPLTNIFSFNLQIWFNNLKLSLEWLFSFMTPLLFMFSLTGIYYSLKKRIHLAIILWFILPFAYEVLYSKNFNARHTLLLSIPLIILASYSISILIKKYFRGTLIFLFLTFAVFVYHDYFIWFNPLKLPDSYKFGRGIEEYVKGFSSGYGVMEAVKYLENNKKQGPINIVIRNDHGNPEDAIVAFFNYDEGVGLSIFDKPYKRLKTVKNDTPYPVYYVSRGVQYGGLEKYFKNAKIFKKPNDAEFIGVYKIDMGKL